MKNTLHKTAAGIALISTLLYGCKVDTLSDIKALAPTVSLVQTGSGTVSLKPEDVTVDKANQLLRKTLGIAYAGYNANDAFTAEVELDLSAVPDGYETFAPGECYITAAPDDKNPAHTLEVAAGARQKAFYVNITKAAIAAHAGKQVAATVRMGNVSLYQPNEKADSVVLLMDMNDFGSLKVDVTATYLKNPGFARAAGTTDRFSSLADWMANAAVTNSRPQGAGFDSNVGMFGIERWSGGDPSIINGKIYQSFNLPAGNYQLALTMGTVIPDLDTYLAVAAGASLPDAAQIGTAIASQPITADFNSNTLTLLFTNPADQQVSAGFLLNFDQGTQKAVQASGIKMYKIESLFD